MLRRILKYDKNGGLLLWGMVSLIIMVRVRKQVKFGNSFFKFSVERS